MHKSVHELLATPSACRRKLDATFTRSRCRNLIPEQTSIDTNEVIVNRSNQLNDIGLTGIKWETYRVNALYDFNYQKLKCYERILASQIKNDVSQIESDSQYKSHQFIIKIQSFPGMFFSEGDNLSVKITVVTEDEEGCQVECFTGFLLSIERKKGYMEEERIAAEAIILPLFLVVYTDKKFLESVKYFLEDNFACFVGPLKFSSYDLIFMLFLFSSPGKDKPTETTVIEYKGPSKNLSSIDYVIDPHTIAEIWKRMTAQFTEEISEVQVYHFLSVLEQHFYNIFTINLSYLELQSIRTPLARVQADHSIIVWKSDKLYYVMRHITHLAQELY